MANYSKKNFEWLAPCGRGKQEFLPGSAIVFRDVQIQIRRLASAVAMQEESPGGVHSGVLFHH
jgi:hypothetical protein